MDTKSIAPSSSKEESGRRLHGFALFSVLTALMLTLLLEALDQTVVGTALPKIIGTLQGFDRYTWAIAAYILASTTMIPIVGKLSDQFGRKWFLLVGTAIFLLGSALAGASQTMNQFIAFRALQGFGTGIGIALAFVLVADIFPPAERVKWQSLFGVVYGFASLVGPTLGGWLTDHGPLVGTLVTETTRWRWVFYINIPVGIIVLAALLIYLPANISARTNQYTGWAAVRRIDVLGAGLSAAATICLLLGLTWGSSATYEWSSPQVIGILAAAAMLFGAFLLAERIAVEPILPLDLFRNQVFAVASLLSLLQLMVLVGLIVYLPLFLQGVLGVSATSAGAVITPLTVSSVIGAALAGFAITVLKRYRLITILSALIMTAGVFLLTRITPTTSLLEAIIFMVIAGIGLGPFFSVLTIAAQNALPRTRLGIGTSAVRYLSQLGTVLGVAIVGTVVNNTLASDIANRLPATAVKQLTPAGVKVATSPQVLVNPTYRETVVRTAEGFARKFAVAQVPPGPQHDQIAASVAAQAVQQVQHLLNQVFEALRLSLAVAIQHGLIAVLLFLSIALGLISFVNPLSTLYFIAVVIAIRVIIRGVKVMIDARRSRHKYEGLTWLFGILLVLFGLALFLTQSFTLVLVVIFISTYAFCDGLYLLIRGLLLRFAPSVFTASLAEAPESLLDLPKDFPPTTWRAMVFVRHLGANGLGHIGCVCRDGNQKRATSSKRGRRITNPSAITWPI